MSRLPNVPITILLATARWLMCVDKLTVSALRLAHKRTATDRIAAVCRLVKAEARQRTQDAVAHGVIAERPSRSAARRPVCPRPTAEAPAARARSPRHTMRAQQPASAPRNAHAPHRAVPSAYGPRDAVIAALSAQARVAHAERLKEIADEQRLLRERIAGVERQIAASLPSPITPTAFTAPSVTARLALPSLVRRSIARARSVLRFIFCKRL